MLRVFSYCRVLTAAQLNENQLMEIKHVGSDARPDAQGFLSAGITGCAHRIWPLTRGPGNPARRYPG